MTLRLILKDTKQIGPDSWVEVHRTIDVLLTDAHVAAIDGWPVVAVEVLPDAPAIPLKDRT